MTKTKCAQCYCIRCFSELGVHYWMRKNLSKCKKHCGIGLVDLSVLISIPVSKQKPSYRNSLQYIYSSLTNCVCDNKQCKFLMISHKALKPTLWGLHSYIESLIIPKNVWPKTDTFFQVSQKWHFKFSQKKSVRWLMIRYYFSLFVSTMGQINSYIQ